MGASGCPYLNYTERLPHKSPGTPGIFHPHPVLQSFDLPHFEVLPRVPHAYSRRHLLRIFKYGKVHGQVHAVLQTTTRHCVATFTPFFRVSIHHGARGNITDVHMVASYGFTIVGKPQEELSPVHYFLLASTVIFHHIGRYPICHAGHHCMQIATPLVLELPPLSSEGI